MAFLLYVSFSKYLLHLHVHDHLFIYSIIVYYDVCVYCILYHAGPNVCWYMVLFTYTCFPPHGPDTQKQLHALSSGLMIISAVTSLLHGGLLRYHARVPSPSVVSNSNDRKRLNKLCEISLYFLRSLAQQFVDINKTRPLLYQCGNDSVDHMTVELVTSKCEEFGVTRRARSGNTSATSAYGWRMRRATGT
jgi:hypothetical protein